MRGAGGRAPPPGQAPRGRGPGSARVNDRVTYRVNDRVTNRMTDRVTDLAGGDADGGARRGHLRGGGGAPRPR